MVRKLKMPFPPCISFSLLAYFIVFVYHILIVYDIQIQIKIIVARKIKLRQSKEWKWSSTRVIFVHQIQTLSEIMTPFCHFLSSRQNKKCRRTMRTSAKNFHPNLHIHITLTQRQIPVKMRWRSTMLMWTLSQSMATSETPAAAAAAAAKMKLSTLRSKFD